MPDPLPPRPPIEDDAAPEPSLLRSRPTDEYLRDGWMPVRRGADGSLHVIITDDEPPPAAIEAAAGRPLSCERVTPWQLRRLLLDKDGERIAQRASLGLWEARPELSARTTFTRAEVAAAAVVGVVIVVLGVFFPVQVLSGIVAAASLGFLANTAFKFGTGLLGARGDIRERVSADEVASLDDDDLPLYTVLVPVFREANIVGDLVKNLGALDYPVHKLEVLILVEEEDQETRDAVHASDPPEHFHLVTVPKGHPQTKPRACNVGLQLARGEHLVIYDAEDAPEPDQLKKAIIGFRRQGETTAVLQAALNYFNADENALTRMFTLEYNYWFYYMLAGLDSARLPIPLGGTSNHFRTSVLRRLGGWDPFNVTEDADLGIRAAALGYRVGVIDSTTMEEANTSIPNFVRQRSRWIKGYMQTTLVYARHPIALVCEIGWRRFIGFLLLIAGTPVAFLGVIPLTLVTAATLTMPWLLPSGTLPSAIVWLAVLNFVLGSALMIHLSMMGPYKQGTFLLVPWSLLNPVYWMLHSAAAYKALWQLIVKPHYWEKTEHGLTKREADA